MARPAKVLSARFQIYNFFVPMFYRSPSVELIDGYMMPSQCNSCLHFEGFGLCPAFPDGIPVEIVGNNILHDEVLEGQEGEYIYQKTSA